VNNIEQQLYRAFAAMDAKKKRGRPATPRGPYNPIPCRSLGRVSDADWHAMQLAAEAAGQTFTAWAVTTLLRKAKRG
jgi:hypothetical protein